MPCDSIITNRVNLSAANIDLLRQTLEAMGAQYVSLRNNVLSFYFEGVSYGIQNGQLAGSNQKIGALADRIKRAYAKQCVSSAAQRYGWIEKDAGETQTTLTKRY